jgi:hypothetical protein
VPAQFRGIAAGMTTTPPRPQRQTIPLAHAAAILGIGDNAAYQLVARKRWPTPVIQVGRLYVVPRWALKRLLEKGNC